jgi:hypothetical protein
VTTPRLTDEQIDLPAWAVANTGSVRFSDQRETLEALIAEVRALRSASPVAQGEPRADLASVEAKVDVLMASAFTDGLDAAAEGIVSAKGRTEWSPFAALAREETLSAIRALSPPSPSPALLCDVCAKPADPATAYVECPACFRPPSEPPSATERDPRDEDAWVVECLDARFEDALFWRPKDMGYTTDLSAAGRYTREEAECRAQGGDGDRAHRLADVMALARPTVDRDELRRAALRSLPAAEASPDRYCVCGHAESAHAVLHGLHGARYPSCLILGGPTGGCGCREFHAAPAATPETRR